MPTQLCYSTRCGKGAGYAMRERDGWVGAHNAVAALRAERGATTLRRLALVLVALYSFSAGPLARGQSQPEPTPQGGADLRAQQVQARNQQVVALFRQGQYADALRLAQQTLEVAEQTLGPEHPDTARSVSNLGGLYDAMGQYQQALPLYERALAIAEKALGPEHPDTAINVNNLGYLYHEMGQYQQALPLYERALAINEKALGPEHPETATSVNNLAGLYLLMGAYEEALPLYKRALAINEKEKALGPEHPDTAINVNNLGYLYQAMGQYQQALPLYKRALAIREKALGPEHPDTARSVNHLGALYQAMGRFEQALQLHQRALAIAEKALGPEHPTTATIVGNLGLLYNAMGQSQQALPLYERAFAIGLTLPTPAERSDYAGNLCGWHRDRKQLGLAIFYCKLAVNQYQQLRQGARELEVTLQRSLTAQGEPTYRELAKLLIQQGRIAEAEQVLGMLKEYEYFEFVRRTQAKDTRTTLSEFTAEEKLLADRLEQSARELTRVYAEREPLRKLSSPSVEQQQRLNLLEEQLALENEKLNRLFAQIKTQLAEQARPSQATRAESLVQGKGATQGMLQSLRQNGNAMPALIYIVPEDKNTLFLIHTQEGLRQVQGGLGEQALNEKIAGLRQAIEKRDASYVASASELYEALIGPVEPYLAESRVDMLMLYLTDALRYLPFSALYDKKTGRHLAEKYASAVYTHVGRETLRDAPHQQWRAVGLGTSQKTPNHASLPAVESELKRVVRDPADTPPLGTLPGKRYLNNEFDETLFAKLTRGDESPPVMHVATHFVLAAGNDQDSALILGNGKQITLAQISANAQLSGYDLITLSACETALGGGKAKENQVGAEVEGLGAVLQKQGAKGVLATLWKVDDTGTALLMEQFYKARGENRKTTKAQALQQAQRALLSGEVKADDPKKHALRHPYYWAPFILMGNWL